MGTPRCGERRFFWFSHWRWQKRAGKGESSAYSGSKSERRRNHGRVEGVAEGSRAAPREGGREAREDVQGRRFVQDRRPAVSPRPQVWQGQALHGRKGGRPEA